MRLVARLCFAVSLLLGAYAGTSISHEGIFYSKTPDPALAISSGIHKIKHVVIIMQESRRRTAS
jgi:phospholipase C